MPPKKKKILPKGTHWHATYSHAISREYLSRLGVARVFVMSRDVLLEFATGNKRLESYFPMTVYSSKRSVPRRRRIIDIWS